MFDVVLRGHPQKVTRVREKLESTHPYELSSSKATAGDEDERECHELRLSLRIVTLMETSLGTLEQFLSTHGKGLQQCTVTKV